MAEFDKLLRTFYEWNNETSFVDHVGISSSELAPGYSVKEWINAERRNRDRWQFLRLLQGKAPFRMPEIPDNVEYTYGMHVVLGLGYADHYYGLCLSLHMSEAWDSTEIAVDRMVLDDGVVDGAIIESVEVLHSSTYENAESHQFRWREQRSRLPVKREGRRLRHLRFGIMVECLESKYFYSVDHAGHGSSAVKRFVERVDALYWDADLDIDGNVMDNKHKSAVGARIPKTELHAV
jgi:hypothetical protein